jgi:2-isopropylmalate synthase
MGEVTITLDINNRKFIGRGASTDILEASAKAYISAINRYKTFVSVGNQ